MPTSANVFCVDIIWDFLFSIADNTITMQVLVLHPLDELFDRPSLTAVADMMPPDTFNSGLMVVSPSSALFKLMISHITLLPSYNGGDQVFNHLYCSISISMANLRQY